METTNYKETTVAGSSWERASNVQIYNPLGGSPYLVFGEEKVFVLAGENVKRDSNKILVKFDINNLNHLQLYNLLNDIYIEERTKRDEALVTP